MADQINTHDMRIGFGRHKGELFTRIPANYLLWMVNSGCRDAHVARAELDRRGTTFPELEVSHHAIDRASLRLRRTWHETSHDGEGIASWLARIAAEALHSGTLVKDKIVYRGMKFAFDTTTKWPVLKSVMPARSKNGNRRQDTEADPDVRDSTGNA